MKLTEITSENDPSMGHDLEVERNGIRNIVNRWCWASAVIKLEKDLSVNVNVSISIDSDKEVGDILPVKFSHIGGNLKLVKLQKLKSLDGCPAVIGDFEIKQCPELTSLANGPKRCINFLLENCQSLTSLEHMPSLFGDFEMFNCPQITSLIGIEKILKFESANSEFISSFKDIKEGGIGLLLINNLAKISTVFKSGPFRIISKYAGFPDKIFECQNELIEAGFEEYAQL